MYVECPEHTNYLNMCIGMLLLLIAMTMILLTAQRNEEACN